MFRIVFLEYFFWRFGDLKKDCTFWKKATFSIQLKIQSLLKSRIQLQFWSKSRGTGATPGPRFQRPWVVREGEDIEAGWKAKDVQRGVKGGLLGSICLDRTPPPAPSMPASLRLPAFGASVFQYFPNQANNRSQGTGWRIAVSDRQQQQPLASTQGSEIKNFIRKLFVIAKFSFSEKDHKNCRNLHLKFDSI